MHRPRCTVIAIVLIATLAWAAPASAELTAPPLDPEAFSRPTAIDNTWFPLVPGIQYIYEGQADRGDGLVSAQVVFTVTDVTKVVDGVRTRVVWDRDFSDGELVEEEIHFHAQDDADNVWSLGEYPEERDDAGALVAPATWLSGVDDAQAGIHMQGSYAPGSPPHVQGTAPNADFFNAAQYVRTDARLCHLPLRHCFADVLVINEFSPLEADGGSVHKHYAPGLGAIAVEAILEGGAVDQEALALTGVRRLGAAARARANARTLKLDARAYRLAPEVYGDSRRARLGR